jgi:hypothetical protein
MTADQREPTAEQRARMERFLEPPRTKFVKYFVRTSSGLVLEEDEVEIPHGGRTRYGDGSRKRYLASYWDHKP